MKSHADLWPRVTSLRNLYLAFRRARKGKRGRPRPAGRVLSWHYDPVTLREADRFDNTPGNRRPQCRLPVREAVSC